MEGDLTASDRYLLATIFKNRPGTRDKGTEGKVTQGKFDDVSPARMRKKNVKK